MFQCLVMLLLVLFQSDFQPLTGLTDADISIVAGHQVDIAMVVLHIFTCIGAASTTASCLRHPRPLYQDTGLLVQLCLLDLHPHSAGSAGHYSTNPALQPLFMHKIYSHLTRHLSAFHPLYSAVREVHLCLFVSMQCCPSHA